MDRPRWSITFRSLSTRGSSALAPADGARAMAQATATDVLIKRLC